MFKDPLPGSTNYLNAYDRNGRLIRAAEGAVSQPGVEGRNNATSDDEESGGDDGSRREQNIAGPQAIPKEQPDDLVPFPMNRQFRSQPVLSEDLKDEIWTRIMVQGKSVKVVSAELGVEMRRVGAVVRLKAVEKQWIEKVL